MSDGNEIIDVEAVEIEGSDNLPAVREASTRPRMENRADAARWSEEWWAACSPEVQARRCVAHKSNGDRCLKAAIKGATVCRTHGGATRHVKRAARIRLENAADLMAKQLLGIALTAESEQVKLAAIRDALDRGGLKAPSEVVLSQGEAKPYEQVFDVIGGTAPGESSSVSSGYGAAGHQASPAPAYDEYDNGIEGSESSHDVPPQPAERGEGDRERESEGRHGPRSQRTPAPRETHISGMAAIRMANQANRESGAMRPPLELESPHKRYRRP